MTATRYDVEDLKTALTSIKQKFDQAPRQVVGGLHVNNLRTELGATLKFLEESESPAGERKALKDEPPILNGFKAWADALVWEELDTRKPNPRFICTTLWYCRTLEHRTRWTKSSDGFLLYLSLLPAEQPKAFEWDSANFPVAQWQADGDLQKKSHLKQASYYLDLLNAEFNDREPEEYYKECLWTEMRNMAIPDYNDAVHEWYTYANQHWTALRPQIFTLFNSSNKFNFVQWALEWARDGQPRLFKLMTESPHCSSAEATINLTNDLCTGALSPLHIAALLGLPRLCKDLISAGMDPVRVWKGRIPLHSALEGEPTCFWDYVGRDNIPRDVKTGIWPFRYEFKRYNSKQRAETILAILDAPPSPSADINRGGIELAPMALWAAYKLREPRIFEKTLDKGATVSDSFLKMLIEEDLSPKRPGDKKLLSRLLTYLHGHCLVNPIEDEDLISDSSPLIKDGMDYHTVGWHIVAGSCPLPQANPVKLFLLAQESILAESVFDLERISLEPRFNPNPLPGEFAHGTEPLLHLAVETDNMALVDALVEAGADLTAVDESNRTALMNCESPRMIEKLINELAVPTECQDNEGRTIWHAAAYNNDIAALSALTKYDPRMKSNMVLKSDEGRTPLAEAMSQIERLKDMRYFMGNQFVRSQPPWQPLAARFLLKLALEHGDDECLASPVPLTHLAAAWGDIDMLEDLEALGADWNQLDEQGRTPLHYLTLACSEGFVFRLRELCKDSNFDRHNHNVIEALFINSAPLETEGHFGLRELSHHPSCHAYPTEDAIGLLCTPELLRTDTRDVHPWESFWKTMLPVSVRGAMLDHTMLNLGTAIRKLTQKGVLADYEKKEKRSGVLLLFDREKGWKWPEQHSQGEEFGHYESEILWHIFHKSEKELRVQLAKTDEGIMLLNLAISQTNVSLSCILLNMGAPVFVLSPEKAHIKSPLITAIDSEVLSRYDHDGDEGENKRMRILEALCGHSDGEELTRERISILKAFWFVIQKCDQAKMGVWHKAELVLLCNTGMDLNDLRGDHADCEFLDDVAMQGGGQFIEFLNENGADVTRPCEVCRSRS